MDWCLVFCFFVRSMRLPMSSGCFWVTNATWKESVSSAKSKASGYVAGTVCVLVACLNLLCNLMHDILPYSPGYKSTFFVIKSTEKKGVDVYTGSTYNRGKYDVLPFAITTAQLAMFQQVRSIGVFLLIWRISSRVHKSQECPRPLVGVPTNIDVGWPMSQN